MLATAAIADSERTKLVEELSAMWDEHTGAHSVQQADASTSGAKKLDSALDMRRAEIISRRKGALTSAVDVTSTVKARTSQVDVKKLEKAERKIKAKMEKRDRRNAYEASKLVDAANNQQSFEELYLAVNPLPVSAGVNAGKSKDIQLENVDLNFGSNRILSGASLSLAHGRRYGLIGRNGIGKSTLLRAMALREIAVPPHLTVLYVEQEVRGDDTPAIESVLSADVHRTRLLKEEREINEKLHVLAPAADDNGANHDEQTAQEIEELSTRLGEVQRILVEIGAEEGPSRAGELLAGLGFDIADQSRPARSFSGGWRMRLALARALFCQPDVLLLDEPSNNLDLNALSWLEDYLVNRWPNTLLVVSHDRAFLDNVATDIILQANERLESFRGNFHQFWVTREERRKNQQKEYENQMAYRANLQAFVDRWRYNANRAPQAQSRLKILEKLPELEPPEQDDVVTFKFPPTDKISPPLLQLNNVGFAYSKDKQILRDVNIDVGLDSRLGLIGPNGAGKSTLLKLLIGELSATSGSQTKNGRLRIAYFAQHHIDSLDLTITPVAWLARHFPGRSETEYRAHLGAFGITGMTGLQLIGTLSGGQKSRVSFATLSLMHPHILVLDEVSSSASLS